MFTKFCKRLQEFPENERIPFTQNFHIEFFHCHYCCRLVKSLIFFPKKTLSKMYLVQTFKIVWLDAVIELISSDCNSIATCADSAA